MKKVFFLLIFAAVSFFLFSCDEKKEDDVYNTGDGENTQTVSNPKFSKQSGVYQEELSIEITTETKDASIYFTVDGTNPDDKSTLYSEPVNIPLETTTAIKAIAYKDKLKPSAVVSSNYEVTGVLDKPEFNIAPGVYTEPQSISLSHNDPEVIIRYTTDGTDPSSKSKTYSIPFSLVNESSTDIKAKAFKAKWGDSSTAQGLFVITGTVISPEFATEPGTYTEAKTITITCENPEAEIRYEVYNEDGGDDPTETSTLYTQPFLVPLDTTVVVKAKAFIPGWNPSPAITGKFVITGTVDLPVFSPIEGTYTSEQSVTISVPTEGAVVGYTVDGSDPTELSPLHSTPIVVPLNTQLLIKAKGFKKDWNPSPAVGGNYTVTGKVAAPAFSIIPNYYTSAQSVAITSTTQGASIKFTIDGSEPTKKHGNEYSAAIPIASTTTLKAIAYKTDWIDSNISEGTYNITGQVPAPVFSPVQGNYTNAQTVSLESNIPGITIRYTTDGSSPSRTAGTIYSGSFTVSSTTTVKAFAYRNDWETSSDSAVSNAVYTITGRASTPKFSVEPGNYTLTKTVALSTETTGAVIRYTVDGSDPSRTAGTLYSAGIVVDKPLTIKAVAYKSDWEESSNSEIATGIYNITGKVFAPVITPAETNHTNNVEVTLSSITSGAKIRFTTNGDTPTRVVGTLYTAPFSVSTGSTVKAIAYKDEWEESSNSDISSRAYVITGRVINPKFDIVPGNYTTGKTVKITTETTGTVIRYTLDGSVPSRTNGTIYTTAGIAINQTTTVKTIAYKTDWQESSNSDVITGTYTITGIVLAPEITPTQLNHTSSVTVSISSATTDASIRYTTNGIDPTPASGILYTDPFVISANSTVKAIAFRTDWEDSSKSTITSKVYTITGKVEKPKLSVEPGNYTSTVSLTLSCDTTGAKIRFTDDGSTPSRTAGTLYTAAISIPSTRTIKVIAYKDDWQDSSNSDVVSATYTITGKVVTPVMTPFTGNYTENTSVTIDTLTEDAVIRYTTNGTTPSRTNGLIYTGPILVNSTTTLKAFAYMTDWQITSDSDVVTGTFTITGKVANPLFSIEPGNYTASKDVTISTPTTGATIKYTLNGDQPSRDVGTIYTTKLTISSSTTVKAIAFKSDWQSSSDSNVVSALYNITGKVATPTINPAAQNNTDNVEVSISSLTEGAVIRYTTDGTNPTRSIGTIYGDPFTLSSSATVKAIAYKTDW
ncbi:MAG TPA: chitobiase/beta-hexosaminidase C-terminal domain-containing protein, partial [bacterium]|nr:chitobiase/beta-hexosaminidase C-terminal domain-containing protein [bacterium]